MILVWNIILLVVFLLFLSFAFVIAFGAPYLPTLKNRVSDIVKLAELKSGQTVLELGSGDGRVLLAFAKQGINVVGYELNPVLVLYSKIITFKYRSKVQVKWGNYWKEEWPDADVVFVFLLQRYMQKLDQQIIQRYSKGVKLISFAFKIPGKAIRRQKKGMYLYDYN